MPSYSGNNFGVKVLTRHLRCLLKDRTGQPDRPFLKWNFLPISALHTFILKTDLAGQSWLIVEFFLWLDSWLSKFYCASYFINLKVLTISQNWLLLFLLISL